MSDSVWPHRWQPTRLPHPWDSPGKNTGMGCRFLLQCMKVKSEREVAQSCPTLSDPMDCSLPGSSAHGIFLARVLEWGATLLLTKRPCSSVFSLKMCSRLNLETYRYTLGTLKRCVAALKSLIGMAWVSLKFSVCFCLFRYHWHTTLLISDVQHNSICIYCEKITTIGLVNIDHQIVTKIFFLHENF